MTPELPEPSALPAGPSHWPPQRRWPQPLHTAIHTLREYVDDDGASAREHNREHNTVLVGLSGGADSLALAVALAETHRIDRHRHNWRAGAIIVDHQLQPGSATVAARTATVARTLGLDPVLLRAVTVTPTGDGPEAAARHARYRAFGHAATDTGAHLILTAHTADDQAEQVLLGLTRGSGLRSLAGIRPHRALTTGTTSAASSSIRLVRPLLGLTRADTETICQWAGITWWNDPTNTSDHFLRSRLRTRLLPALAHPDTGLGPGITAGLQRTAQLAAEDAEALELWAEQALAQLLLTEDDAHREHRRGDVVVMDRAGLAELPRAVALRVLARAAQQLGAQELSRERLVAVHGLIRTAGQGGTSAGPIQLAGGITAWRQPGRAGRRYGTLVLVRDTADHPRTEYQE